MLTLHRVLIHLGLTTTLGNGVCDSPISERKNEAHDHGRSWKDAGLTEQDYSTWSRTDVTTPPVWKQQCCTGSDLALLPEPSFLPAPGTQPTLNCCQTGLIIPFSQWRSLKGLSVNDKFYPLWHGVGGGLITWPHNSLQSPLLLFFTDCPVCQTQRATCHFPSTRWMPCLLLLLLSSLCLSLSSEFGWKHPTTLQGQRTCHFLWTVFPNFPNKNQPFSGLLHLHSHLHYSTCHIML